MLRFRISWYWFLCFWRVPFYRRLQGKLLGETYCAFFGPIGIYYARKRVHA